MHTVAVIDFETTGSWAEGDERATEIAAVLVRDGRIVDRFQSLMNSGARVHPFVQRLTGISDEMVRAAPPAARVMREAVGFVGAHPLVAHNAAFDRRVWDAELDRLGRTREGGFACTMLLARRIYPQAPGHGLSTLARFAGLPAAGRAHRALADAETAANLLLRLESELQRRFGLDEVTHEMLQAIQATPRGRLEGCIARLAGRPCGWAGSGAGFDDNDRVRRGDVRRAG